MRVVNELYAAERSAENSRALEIAITECLRAGESAERIQALKFLAEHYRVLDPRPFASEIRRADTATGAGFGQALLDDAELYYSPRQDREVIYREGIITGKARFGSDSELERFKAIYLASLEGFDSLRELIELYWPLLPAEAKGPGWLPLDRIDAQLTLFAGAENDADGNRRAVRRLADMTPAQLAAGLDTGEGYRQVIRSVMANACHEGGASACESVKRTLEQQQDLIRRERQASPSPPKDSDAVSVRQRWVTGTGGAL